MKKVLLLLIIACLVVIQDSPATTYYIYSRAELEALIPKPGDYHPLPADQSWKDSLDMVTRNAYVTMGQQYKGKSWEKIPDKLFAEYRTNGNRRNYEAQWEERQRQLARLAMAEVMEGRGTFIPDIIRGLHYFIETTWWGIPAHYPSAKPDADNQVVDLYDAEVANLIAWTTYLLHDPIETADPGLCEKTRGEIARRLLTPARTIDYDWKRRTTNWNPWICSNWLSCVLLCETDRQRQLDAVAQILQSMDIFYEAYPEDGGCDEGISYWFHGAASLFECLQILHIATNGQINHSGDAKLKAMAAFAYKTYIANRQSVNFADAYVNSSLQINIAYPFGHYVGDETLMAYSAFFAKSVGHDKNPTIQFDANLSRELLFLRLNRAFKQQQPAEPLEQDGWLPNLQMMTARQYPNTTKGLFLAAKAGHNGESHNHNDVGSYIVYADGEPVIIDIGTATYTAQTFSKDRYKLFNTRSAYHNVPEINGVEQQEGKSFRATRVKYAKSAKQASLTLDISKAYPEEARVKKWIRTLSLNRQSRQSSADNSKLSIINSQFSINNGVQVTEDYSFSRPAEGTKLHLICCGTVSINNNGTVTISSGKAKCLLHYDPQQLQAAVEPVTTDDPTVSNSWKGRPINRLTLTFITRAKKGKTTYTISSVQ